MKRPSVALNRPELGQSDLRCHIVEHDFHCHANVDLIQGAIDDAAHHADALIKLDEGEIVRDIFLETRGGAMADGKGIDFPPAPCPGPPHIKGKARRAEITGVEMVLPT